MGQAPSRRDFLKSSVLASASLALAAEASAPAAAADGAQAAAQPEAYTAPGFTRGIGLYPGAPGENFQPTVVPDASGAVRNLALRRPAWHSSAYDYNTTAQLVTDGIVHTEQPRTLGAVVTGYGILPKEDREVFIDHYPMNVLPINGELATIDHHFEGGGPLEEVDLLRLFLVISDRTSPADLHFAVSVSDDGRGWREVGTAGAGAPVPPTNWPPDLVRQSTVLMPSIRLSEPVRSAYYRVTCRRGQATPEGKLAASTGAVAGSSGGEERMVWRVGQIEFHRNAERVELAGPYHFTSAWKSAGAGTEWVYVDLGEGAQFDRVVLHWVAAAAEGSLQASDHGDTWRDLAPLGAPGGNLQEVRLGSTARARYLRVLMTRPVDGQGYVLSELEVWGRGGFTAQPAAMAGATPAMPGRHSLAGGKWRVERDSLVTAPGEELARAGFRDDGWVVATVPGTTLTSWFNAGAVPDPNYGENQLHISDSFFYADFWYRTEFMAPEAPAAGQLQWMCFDGINWKADVYLNGAKLGRIEGGFTRGRWDVTGKLKPGPNALAVRVEKNHTPGSCKQKTFESTGKNGGGLGADNPTFHASIGWDWIPTIRGRNTGIWSEVYLQHTGPVLVEDPLVSSTLPLPDTSRAEVQIECVLTNATAKSVSGVLRGRFGTLSFAQPVKLGAAERQVVKLAPLTVNKPELWWPVGYGEPHLYDAELTFEPHGGKGSAETRHFKAGIRQMRYSEEGGALRMWVNGRRFIAKGGNWGFSESMLRYRAREYDVAVRYHREMNMNMVRNWVGQIGDMALYEACDRHGVMVWQDFWLANPWDGPIPDDNALFLANARDFLLRIRHHASMGIYCGRNEGDPPAALEAGFRALLKELHPDLFYIPSSADYSVSGHGPYSAQAPAYYFQHADVLLHSEIGAPSIPPVESVRAMMPASALWPQGLSWGLHDFCMQSAQNCASLRTMIDVSYGGAETVDEWLQLAAFVNYDTYRAMFEAQSRHRMGLLLWMSHPCWPSFVWQTYDYYFEPTSTYFGCKKACEPLHVQWNAMAETVEVLNWSGGAQTGMRAVLEVVNLDGRKAFEKQAQVDSPEDSTVTAFAIEYPASGLSDVHFLRLRLADSTGRTVSTNFYHRGLREGDFRALRSLAPVQVTAATTPKRDGDRWLLKTELRNADSGPALMVRLKAVREKTEDRILPAVYSDNYIALMPGEQATVTTEVREADTRGEAPKIVVSGFRVQAG